VTGISWEARASTAVSRPPDLSHEEHPPATTERPAARTGAGVSERSSTRHVPVGPPDSDRPIGRSGRSKPTKLGALRAAAGALIRVAVYPEIGVLTLAVGVAGSATAAKGEFCRAVARDVALRTAGRLGNVREVLRACAGVDGSGRASDRTRVAGIPFTDRDTVRGGRARSVIVRCLYELNVCICASHGMATGARHRQPGQKEGSDTQGESQAEGHTGD
jgi:hypothetical protein